MTDTDKPTPWVTREDLNSPRVWILLFMVIGGLLMFMAGYGESDCYNDGTGADGGVYATGSDYCVTPED